MGARDWPSLGGWQRGRSAGGIKVQAYLHAEGETQVQMQGKMEDSVPAPGVCLRWGFKISAQSGPWLGVGRGPQKEPDQFREALGSPELARAQPLLCLATINTYLSPESVRLKLFHPASKLKNKNCKQSH